MSKLLNSILDVLIAEYGFDLVKAHILERDDLASKLERIETRARELSKTGSKLGHVKAAHELGMEYKEALEFVERYFTF